MTPHSILRYIVESGICLISFYLLYWILLRRETFYQLNRVYLISTLVISIVLPLLHIPFPVEISDAAFIPSISSVGQSILPSAIIPSEHGVPNQSTQFNWFGITVVVYLLGTAVMLAKTGFGIAKILKIIGEGIIDNIDAFNIVYTKRNISPFSFFNYVFLMETQKEGANVASILDHEYVHIRQRHTYDNVFIELVLAFYWFNPIIWLYREAIKDTHEYLADDGVIENGNSLLAYKSFILEQVFINPEFPVSSSFASRIRKRVVMINLGPSKTAAKVKVLLAIPMTFILSVLFAGQDYKLTQEPQYPPIVYDWDSTPIFYMGQDVYRFPEEPATFNGGPWQDFGKYVSEKMETTDVRAQPGSRGLVIVSFIIDFKGDLSYAHAVLSDAPDLEEEAIRIINSSSKKWKSAKQDGEDVSSVFVYSFRFAQ